ncbi:MAG TPA: hypothetical protein VGX23_33225 [Actinocrinis sp.]|nr:hypothetical protein [Actinocrinis sp.]
MATDTEDDLCQDDLDDDEETSLEDLPLGPAGRGIWDEAPSLPHQTGEGTFHVGCALVEHGLTLLDADDYDGKYGVTVQWTDPNKYASPHGEQVASIWRVPEPGRIDPLAGRLDRYTAFHRNAADRVRQYILDVLNSDLYDYSASLDEDNPSVILVTVH